MQSKTLSSEFTILKKDVTRFAPVWLALCTYLTIWGVSMMPQKPGGLWGSNFYEPIAPIFAPILAVSVFGYLCDPRECNMVHSLPLRRERLFGIHVISASLMFLIPTALFCVLTRDWTIQRAGYRFLFTGAEFFLLFSIGVFCMMLTGRKVGAVLLYIFIQSIAILASLVIHQIYLPLLPGIYMGHELMNFSPMLLIGSNANFMNHTAFGREELTFLILLSLISLAILALSMYLYRRRRMERAGDLLVVGWLDPFFASCSGITGFSLMAMSGDDSKFLLLPLGCAIGYFAYWMLSKKTGRVFTPKILGGLVCLVAALLGTMYLTYLDPLDRVYHVPEANTVEKVTLGQGSYVSEAFSSSEPEVIADLGALHLDLAKHYVPSNVYNYELSGWETIHLTYYLKNGRILEREYKCADEALLRRAAWYLSQPEARFYRENPDFVTVDIRHHGSPMYLDPRLLPEFEEVLVTECREGRMFDFQHKISGWTINFQQRNPEWHTYMGVPVTAVDTIAWLEEHCTAAN